MHLHRRRRARERAKPRSSCSLFSAHSDSARERASKPASAHMSPTARLRATPMRVGRECTCRCSISPSAAKPIQSVGHHGAARSRSTEGVRGRASERVERGRAGGSSAGNLVSELRNDLSRKIDGCQRLRRRGGSARARARGHATPAAHARPTPRDRRAGEAATRAAALEHQRKRRARAP